ncbi:MAG: aminotransferase class V-fold PLP-dependent enzyme [Candidatus Ranarchaeia archaeon]|jgi:cysteine desulfurase/selenocysteine lyase
MVVWSRVREDFPVLQRHINGKHIIYMDSACMSLKPKPVIDSICYYYTELGACAGRSSHALGHETTELCEESRLKMQELINAKKVEEILWTKNTTEALNLVANAFNLEGEGSVVTTSLEHHSGMLPFYHAAKRYGLDFKIIPPNSEGIFDLSTWEEAIDNKTKLISLVHVSNLTGTTAPVKEIVKIAHDHGAKVIVDGAQSAPHQPIDVQNLDVDFFAFSIHKMCGPTGVGVLYGKKELLEDMGTFLVGGDTIKDVTYSNGVIEPSYLGPPSKFEAGLQNYAGIIGAGAAASYLMKIGMDNIRKREEIIGQHLLRAIADIDEIEIIGPVDPKKRGALVSFKVRGVEAALDVGRFLDEQIPNYQIMVRSGAHCVHPFHYSLDIAPKQGTSRASLYIYNSIEEI